MVDITICTLKTCPRFSSCWRSEKNLGHLADEFWQSYTDECLEDEHFSEENGHD